MNTTTVSKKLITLLKVCLLSVCIGLFSVSTSEARVFVSVGASPVYWGPGYYDNWDDGYYYNDVSYYNYGYPGVFFGGSFGGHHHHGGGGHFHGGHGHGGGHHH